MIGGSVGLRRAGGAAGRRVRSGLLESRTFQRALRAWGLHLSGAPATIPLGRSFPPDHPAVAPVVCFVALGVRPEALAATARRVADVGLATAGLRPLFIIDSADLDVARKHGWVVERLIPRAEWERVDRDDSWTGYALGRVSEAVESYGARMIVPVPPEGLADSAWPALLALGTTVR